MKRGICFLLTLCLILGVMSASLAESQLQGKPWVNPEMPGNLPAQCPAAEENFYLHVNYELHQQYPTEKNTADNTMTDSQKELDEVLWTLVNTGESTEARTLRILSSLIMDGKRREKEGMEPLMRYVRRIQETRNLDEFSALCREEGFVFGTPFGIFNLEQAEQYPERFAITIYLSEPVPMIISDEDDPDASYEPQLDTAKVEEELMQLGYTAPNARQLAERMVQYQNMEPIYEESDLETLTTKIALTSADIQKLCVPLYDQMVSQGMILEGEANTAIYQTIDVPAFRSLQNLWTEENLDLFQAIVSLAMLRYAQDYLDPASYARAHEITEEMNLKNIALEYMRMYARTLTEQAYADAFVTPEQRSLVKELTEEYKQALRERMERCPWLSEESRKNLMEKASSIQVTVVTPDERVDYEPLLNELSAGDISLLDAVIQYDLTNQHFLLNVAEHPFVRSHRARFIHGMLDVNAVYEPDKNSVFVMAGMLRNGFYNDSSRETLLATIGQTIAHEIGHGFDANGVQYDAAGAYNSVLTEEDQSKYREKLMRIAEELNSLEVADGVFENGTRILNEAEADLLGLQLTLDLAKKTEGFDYDLFFRTQARKFFRAFKTVDSALDNYSSDQHPAYFIRVNYTFAQFGEFYRAYPSIQEGTPMYYAPADRETLW